MEVDLRRLDAYCTVCTEPTVHLLDDPGSCHCSRCENVQQMVVPAV